MGMPRCAGPLRALHAKRSAGKPGVPGGQGDDPERAADPGAGKTQ